MDSGWILANVLWCGIIGVTFACLISEWKKTPEQRKAEAERLRESWKKNRAAEKSKRQKVKDNAPAKGCLQSTLEFGAVCIFLMIAVLVCVMLLIVSGN